MRNLFYFILICFSLVACTKDDDGSVTFNFTYTFSPNSADDSESTSSVLVYDKDGNDIGGSDLAFLTGIKSSETKSVDVTVDRGGILQFSGFTKDGFKRVFTDNEVTNGANVSWNSAESIARVNSDTGSNGDNENTDNCSPWVEETGACLSATSSGVNSLPGVRKRWCKKDLGNGSFEYTVIFEPINGGIDENFAFYQRVRIVTECETFELNPAQFNSQGGFTSSHNSNVDADTLTFFIECVQ
mgnify:CR=1 FL=1